ncbi:Peptide deformylase [Sedimentisphaera cyanobacteriorum]|uniref:Peptide deformylase n=1 Tax=Sedimentisphaera cyanobacteriorum TaxID=1940790 RepID=A0A1Q2HT25_9BACT|nr:peptide deformylase [Sedimentisphaera cyanobacteriorum]AQQ10504.1 Peptide deformylase [Sedimentisphaera cyanobacteriorum]
MIDLDKCRLTFWPEPVLLEKAQEVEKIDDNIRAFVDKMLDIMVESNGIGLAAPQANAGLRIFVVSLNADKEHARVFINPELKLSGEVTGMQEGCLSVPDINTKIERPSKAVISAANLEGERFTLDAEGLLAKCLQHENDHLNGKTIVERMSRMSKLRHKSQIDKLKADLISGQGSNG